MKIRKELMFGIYLLGIFLAIALINSSGVESQEASVCCERLSSGAWCQNAPSSACDSDYRNIPASCEAASFCRLGYCIDSIEGTCSQNTPQRVCDDNGGIWQEDTGSGPPPQCTLGCCMLNDQSAFVTLTRCKQLSSNYGLETDYRSDITSEFACIAAATSDVEGACVYEEEFQRTCKFTTQKDCGDLKGTSDGNSTISFHPDFLCSDETLNTNCGPSKETTCVEGKDQIYFVDTCGNLANIYDSSKVDDQAYWSKVVAIDDSCGVDSVNGNAGSSTCGNCDYYLGSTCKEYKAGEDRARPNVGDNVCRDLSCNFESETYKHGETWCADSSGRDKALPGSRDFRMLCYNGEVTVEPCADYRQEVCLQSDVNDFKVAACRVNQWQDCFSQTDRQSCENIDKRDCQWFPDLELVPERQEAESDVQIRESTTVTSEQPFNSDVPPGTGNAIGDPLDPNNLRDDDPANEIGVCLPSIAPGFNFWEEGDAQSLCALANKECVVKFEKGSFGGSWECVENCECLEDDWELTQNNLCTAIGDCGNSINYIGVQGYNTGYRIRSGSADNE